MNSADAARQALRGAMRATAMRWWAAVPAAGRTVGDVVWFAMFVLAVALLLLVEGWAAAGVWQYLTHD